MNWSLLPLRSTACPASSRLRSGSVQSHLSVLRPSVLCRLFTALFLSSAFLFSACVEEARPADVLDEDTYVDYLIDVYLAEGCFKTTNEYQYDKIQPEIVGMYDSILHNYRLTVDDINRTQQYYMEHSDRFKVVHQRVIDSIERLQSALEEE